MRLRRTLTVAALTVAAVVGLSACQTKVGLAASVDGQRLTDNDLSTYVQAGAAPYTDQNSNSTVVPKVYVLQNWIDITLFAKAVQNKGGTATRSELNGAREVVLSGRTVAQAETFYRKLGYTNKFAGLIIDQSATLVVLVERIAPGITAAQAIAALQNGQANGELLKAVAATKSKVALSSRYGTWDSAKVALTSTPGIGAPDFIRFSPSTASTTTPANP